MKKIYTGSLAYTLLATKRDTIVFSFLVLIAAFYSTPGHAYNTYTNLIKIKSTQGYKSQDLLLRANLFKPEGEGPFPAVVLMHGCGGWQPPVQMALKSYATFLLKHGFAVLNLDSFGPRRNSGGEVCTSFKMLKDARAYRTVDAFDAIRYLKVQDFIDINNVFLMGQSNGGSVAINVAKSTRSDSEFRAVVAYYPWCGAFGSHTVNLSSPLLILGGAKDDWVPPHGCKNVVSNGDELQVTIYPEAPHSFDINILQQRYLGKLVGYEQRAALASRMEMLAFFKKHLRYDS